MSYKVYYDPIACDDDTGSIVVEIEDIQDVNDLFQLFSGGDIARESTIVGPGGESSPIKTPASKGLLATVASQDVAHGGHKQIAETLLESSKVSFEDLAILKFISKKNGDGVNSDDLTEEMELSSSRYLGSWSYRLNNALKECNHKVPDMVSRVKDKGTSYWVITPEGKKICSFLPTVDKLMDMEHAQEE